MTIDDARIDAGDPLYLHPSDHPGQILVAQSFDGHNFGEWRRSMKIALSAKNRCAFVNGSSKKTDNNSAQWERCNDIVISWLINTLSPEIRSSVIYTETAEEIWRQLEARFGQSNGAQLYSIRREISQLTQGSLSISSYFTKWKGLRDELRSFRKLPNCSCKALTEMMKYEEDERLVHFLMGLNESYTGTRGSILMQKPLPSVDEAYSILRQEEKQRGLSAGSVNEESMSMNVGCDSGGLAASELILKDVLLVTAFHCNLLSVGKLVRDLQCSVTFTPSICSMQAPFMKEPVQIGRAEKDLFFLLDSSQDLASTACQASATQVTPPWHVRLGHLETDQMVHNRWQEIANNHVFSNIILGFSWLEAISSYMNTMMFSSLRPPFFNNWLAGTHQPGTIGEGYCVSEKAEALVASLIAWLTHIHLEWIAQETI